MQAFLVLGITALVMSHVKIPPPSEAAITSELGNTNSLRRSRGTTNNRQVSSRPQHLCSSFHSSSLSCQGFSRQLIRSINTHIQVEFDASHSYLAMSSYFARDEVNRRGLAKFFRAAADEEREHGIMFMQYLNKRGGYYSSKKINEPNLTSSDLASPLAAIQKALEMEKDVNDKIMDIHWQAQEAYDPHFQDFLETEFLTEQVDSIYQLAGYVGLLTRLGDDPLALHTFDEELYEGKR